MKNKEALMQVDCKRCEGKGWYYQADTVIMTKCHPCKGTGQFNFSSLQVTLAEHGLIIIKE